MKKLLNKRIIFNNPTQHLVNLLFYVKNKYKIIEFPANYIDTGEKSSTIKLSHFLIFFFQIVFLTFKYYI